MALDKLAAFYENEGEEELRLLPEGAHYLEFLTAARYLFRYLPAGCDILDSCAGTGAYAFYLAQQGHRVTAGDIVPYNVDRMRAKQAEAPRLAGLYQGDAGELSAFAGQSFDAVLCMGALYHMEEEAQRRRVVEESLRVLRDGGLLACTYMNRYAVILNNAVGPLDNLEEILRFAKDGREGIFYASTPEETAALLAGYGLEILCHVALDGVSNFLHTTAGLLDDTGFRRWREYHFAVCEVPSLLGCSYHNLILCRKGGGILRN